MARGRERQRRGGANFLRVRDCKREYSLVSVDGDHASVPTSERERDFAENRKAFVQAGQICDRYPTGFPRVFRTSICDNPCLPRQYITDVRSNLLRPDGKRRSAAYQCLLRSAARLEF